MGSNSPSEFTILYFATVARYTSLSSERFPAPLPLSNLFATLEARYPGIEEKVLRSCAVTVNLEYVDIANENSEEVKNCSTIQPGDEVVLIPPVSSG